MAKTSRRGEPEDREAGEDGSGSQLHGKMGQISAQSFIIILFFKFLFEVSSLLMTGKQFLRPLTQTSTLLGTRVLSMASMCVIVIGVP